MHFDFVFITVFFYEKLCFHFDVSTSITIMIVRTLTAQALALGHAQNGQLPYIRVHASSIQ